MADRGQVIGQWQEHINTMRNFLRDFEVVLPDITTDEEFMSAYSELYGTVLDGIRLPVGGAVDDLLAAVMTGREV